MEFATIKEAHEVPQANVMIRQLMQDHQTVSTIARETEELAGEYADEVTKDLLIGRMRVHDKNAWMLRSLLS